MNGFLLLLAALVEMRGGVALLVIFLASAAHTFSAEVFQDPPVVSPDGSKEVAIRFWEGDMGTVWRIALSENQRVFYRRHLPDKLEIRYVKVSWAPSSKAVLLGENYKSDMDLTLVRIRHRHVKVAHFELGDRMFDKEERELPFQRALQSHAPVARVMWSSVKWLSFTRCTMLYIIHGLGYEGEGDVTIDFHGKRPVMRTSRLRPLSNPDSFNAGD